MWSTGQQVIIRDSMTNKVIPFVTITNGNGFAHSDLNGETSLNLFSDNDMLTFSAIGYKDLLITKLNIKEVLILEVNPIQLDAVVLDVKKQKVVQTKKTKRKGILGDQIIPCHAAITTLVIPNESLFNKQLKLIELKFERHSGYSRVQKEKYRGINIMTRLNIYTRKNDSFGELVYTSNPLSVNAGKKDILEFVVYNVSFNENGFYLQLEHLGALNNNGEFVNCDGLHMMRVDIADIKSSEYDVISYLPAPVLKVATVEPLNYKQVISPNGATGNYFLNYRFSYVE